MQFYVTGFQLDQMPLGSSIGGKRKKVLKKKNCNGFHYMGPKLWNSLPAHIRKTNIRNIFKEKVKDHIWENIPSV